MNYEFEPRTAEQEGVENCGYIWQISPRRWICMCHAEDAPELLALHDGLRIRQLEAAVAALSEEYDACSDYRAKRGSQIAEEAQRDVK